MSRVISGLIIGAVLMVTLSSVSRHGPKFIWNASASVPIGLYAVHSVRRLTVGELVVVEPPPSLSDFLAERRYLPRGVPLLKHVVAIAGARACRLDREITVNGTALGFALARDRIGRRLPVWQGCRLLSAGEFFLFNSPLDSLDGRYFGPLQTSFIVGQAIPIWIPSGQR